MYRSSLSPLFISCGRNWSKRQAALRAFDRGVMMPARDIGGWLW